MYSYEMVNMVDRLKKIGFPIVYMVRVANYKYL